MPRSKTILDRLKSDEFNNTYGGSDSVLAIEEFTGGRNLAFSSSNQSRRLSDGLILGDTPTDRMLVKLMRRWSSPDSKVNRNSVQFYSAEDYGQNPVVENDTRAALSEISKDARDVINDVNSELGVKLDDKENQYTDAQISSGVLGATLVREHERVFNLQNEDRSMPKGTQILVSSNLGGEVDVGRRSFEAYNDVDNRNSMLINFTYNLKAARQDDFGEAFFQTVVVSPETTNVTVVVELLSVFEEQVHTPDGDFEDEFNRKSLVLGLVDPTILNNETTRCHPIFRKGNASNNAKLVDESIITPKEITLENGHKITTQPLRCGTPCGLLGISAPDYITNKGALDQTDQIDPAVKLSSLFIKFKNNEVFEFNNLEQTPEASFGYAAQGQNNEVFLNYRNKWLRIDGMKTIDGTPSALKACTGNYTVNLYVNATGVVNTNTSVCEVSGSIRVYSVFDSSGQKLDLTKGEGKAIVDEIVGAEVIGWYPIAYRLNSNLRERGQLLDVNSERLFYGMPLSCPISVQRSTSESDGSDGSRLEKLIQATYIRCSNKAVETLLKAEQVLKSIKELPDPEKSLVYNSKVLGAARFYVKPTYKHVYLDVAKELNSLTNSGRMGDVESVFINTVRSMVFETYYESRYGAACQMLLGEQFTKPLVVLGTDPNIAPYLQITGDPRNLGDEFTLKVVSTNNVLMRNKIIMVFSREGMAGNELSNPLHFGNMLWRPEFTSIMNVSRSNQISKEITVQPSFLHIVHCPIMMSIDVTNLAQAVAKCAPVFTKTV